MDQVLAAYPNDVKLVFKHLPLPMHPEAKPAARLSQPVSRANSGRCMTNSFDNQANLSAEFYTKTAEKLGLNMENSKQIFRLLQANKSVDEDMELGQRTASKARQVSS
jgi:hypothetical protein